MLTSRPCRCIRSGASARPSGAQTPCGFPVKGKTEEGAGDTRALTQRDRSE